MSAMGGKLTLARRHRIPRDEPDLHSVPLAPPKQTLRQRRREQGSLVRLLSEEEDTILIHAPCHGIGRAATASDCTLSLRRRRLMRKYQAYEIATAERERSDAKRECSDPHVVGIPAPLMAAMGGKQTLADSDETLHFQLFDRDRVGSDTANGTQGSSAHDIHLKSVKSRSGRRNLLQHLILHNKHCAC